MNNTFSISEIICTAESDLGEVQVCASADATYDPGDQRIAVTLDAFARHLAMSGDDRRVPMAWLPARQRVAEHLSRSEASAFTRDVFDGWVRKVRAAVPGTPVTSHARGRALIGSPSAA